MKGENAQNNERMRHDAGPVVRINQPPTTECVKSAESGEQGHGIVIELFDFPNKMQKILLFIPTITGTIPIQTVRVLLGADTDGLEIGFSTTSRTLIHTARNIAIEQAIMGEYTHLLFHDDDNPPVTNTYIKDLLSHGKDIVAGVCRLRNGKALSISKAEQTESGVIKYTPYEELPQERLIKIGNTGCGCVLLSNKVCKAMYEEHQKQPFENKIVEYYKTNDPQPTGMNYIELTGKNLLTIPPAEGMQMMRRELSEDYLFFERAKQLGFEIYCDTSVELYHIGIAPLLTIK